MKFEAFKLSAEGFEALKVGDAATVRPAPSSTGDVVRQGTVTAKGRPPSGRVPVAVCIRFLTLGAPKHEWFKPDRLLDTVAWNRHVEAEKQAENAMYEAGRQRCKTACDGLRALGLPMPVDDVGLWCLTPTMGRGLDVRLELPIEVLEELLRRVRP